MFTGIVTSTGKVMKITKKGDSIHFLVKPTVKYYLKDRKTGDSMSINGACMTITKLLSTGFEFTTIKESLSKTNRKLRKPGKADEIERQSGRTYCTGTC
jgi:riboflavin synthase